MTTTYDYVDYQRYQINLRQSDYISQDGRRDAYDRGSCRIDNIKITNGVPMLNPCFFIYIMIVITITWQYDFGKGFGITGINYSFNLKAVEW